MSAALAIMLLAACGDDAASAEGDSAWKSLAVDCPALTAPAFAGLSAGPASEKIDKAEVLSTVCAYGTPGQGPAVVTQVQIDRVEGVVDSATDRVRNSRTYAEGKESPVITLEGFESEAVAIADGTGAFEASTSSGNGYVSVLVQLEQPVITEAELTAQSEALAQSLRDHLSNLR
ncbi:hypothetical protein FB565_007465 [Actinoplanes lutulentus]|uniref:hypothetical protein n=1 Tax=Actinoplanes lutulentus TaxID=1287878 RepID=UPI0011B939A9|nr:hypothetical protein [Actinoplanes lutulentus]MBB2947694.1 hypothetical protein [Actinoplanes lutulentus]